jgi:hypothetical protein
VRTIRDGERPSWRDELSPRLDDVRVLSALLDEIEKRPEVADAQRHALVSLLRGQVADVLVRGTLTKGERVAIRIQALQVFAALQGRDR